MAVIGSPSRSVAVELTADPSHFTRTQLQARVLLSWTWNGYASWMRTHGVPLRALLTQHNVGTVIAGFTLDYHQPFGFFDADAVTVEVEVTRWGRQLITVRSTISPSDRVGVAATVELMLRPVHIDDPLTLAAEAGPLPSSLASLIPAAVATPGPGVGGPDVMGRIASLDEWSEAGTGETPFVVHSHRIEMADQWAFIEIPAIVETGREMLGLAAADGDRLRSSLTRPPRSISAELHHPLYLLDEAAVHTTAFVTDSGFAFVHRLLSTRPTLTHATIVEEV